MSEIVSLCGYRCDLCPAYNENTKSISDRQKVSDGWLKYFGAKVPPEETGVCVGCLNEGKHIDAGCPVRPCALEKGVDSCAHCKEFICEKLKSRVEYIEKIMKKFGKEIPEEDCNLFIKPYESRSRLMKLREDNK